LEATRGCPFTFVIRYFVVGRAEPQEGGGLARAWTTCRSEGTQYQCPDEAPGGAEGTVATE